MEPEDIFASSLGTLYDYQPITLASAGSDYTHVLKAPLDPHTNEPLRVSLKAPDTSPANWALHASDIWASSAYLADHLDRLRLDVDDQVLEPRCQGTDRWQLPADQDIHDDTDHASPPRRCLQCSDQKIHLLELGAGSGLPSIAIAKSFGRRLALTTGPRKRPVSVTASDYPDAQLLETLSENIARNCASALCHAVAYAWGSDPAPLLSPPRGCAQGFDVIVAADTLWNPELHEAFVQTLQMTLKKSPSARVHLVAGLHTGRYTIHAFLNSAVARGFEIVSATEEQISGCGTREWDVLRRDNEDAKERRRWLVWVVLRWASESISFIPESTELHAVQNMLKKNRAYIG